MRVVFLRGAVPPPHENPEKLLYNNMDECSDLWTQLYYGLLKEAKASGELLYDCCDDISGGIEIDDTFTEKWVKISSYVPNFEPDLIICRGGFKYYDDFLKKFPDAKKIYYGAGRRYWPSTQYTNYDLFLVDSPIQYRDILKNKRRNVRMLVKPAATMFNPVAVDKKYDVCFMANASQKEIKRHRLFIESMAGSGLKILNIGNKDNQLVEVARSSNADITWAGWHHRKNLPALISQCKVGVCCSSGVDSCPRVISEYLACGLPVVVTDNVNLWSDYYINNCTGLLTPEDKIREGVEQVMGNLGSYDPHTHYKRKISMPVAAKSLWDQIRLVLI